MKLSARRFIKLRLGFPPFGQRPGPMTKSNPCLSPNWVESIVLYLPYENSCVLTDPKRAGLRKPEKKQLSITDSQTYVYVGRMDYHVPATRMSAAAAAHSLRMGYIGAAARQANHDILAVGYNSRFAVSRRNDLTIVITNLFSLT